GIEPSLRACLGVGVSCSWNTGWRAGEGNRTLAPSLGSSCSTIELHPQMLRFPWSETLWDRQSCVRLSQEYGGKTMAGLHPNCVNALQLEAGPPQEYKLGNS